MPQSLVEGGSPVDGFTLCARMSPEDKAIQTEGRSEQETSEQETGGRPDSWFPGGQGVGRALGGTLCQAGCFLAIVS